MYFQPLFKCLLQHIFHVLLQSSLLYCWYYVLKREQRVYEVTHTHTHTWETSSWQEDSSRLVSSILRWHSSCMFSSCLQRFTIDFTSDLILLMYSRATVNSSSIAPLISTGYTHTHTGYCSDSKHTELQLQESHNKQRKWRQIKVPSIMTK